MLPFLKISAQQVRNFHRFAPPVRFCLLADIRGQRQPPSTASKCWEQGTCRLQPSPADGVQQQNAWHENRPVAGLSHGGMTAFLFIST
jgi:hypothetical protein